MINLMDSIKGQVAESVKVKQAFLEDSCAMETLSRVAALLIKTYREGRKTLWAGNGGSAADAQHMAAELVNKFRLNRSGLPALALTVDSSILTAIGNDYGYRQVFARQIIACGCPGDVFVGISTSGHSENLVEALAACREKGLVSVAIVGEKPCAMDEYDFVIHIPSADTPRIQECQTLVGHILCDAVESALFGEDALQ